MQIKETTTEVESFQKWMERVCNDMMTKQTNAYRELLQELLQSGFETTATEFSPEVKGQTRSNQQMDGSVPCTREPINGQESK